MTNKAASILRDWRRDYERKHAPNAKHAIESFTLETTSGRHMPLFTGTSFAQTNLRKNTAIEACSRYIRTAIVEASVVVKRRSADGDDEAIQNHPLPALLRRPNDQYLGSAMRAMIAWDLALTGSAYVVTTETAGGFVLHWYPSFSVTPRSLPGSPNWIDWYDLKTETGVERIEPERMIQFLNGIDPSNMRTGYSPLRALLAEVLTDNEATEYTYYVLANTGVPGMIVSPSGNDVDSQQLLANAPEIKRKLQDATTGANRGEPIVMGYPLKIDIPSFSPDQMVLDKLRDIPEERISAVIGIPAAVVGLGTGLQQTKVGATMKELREEAYEGCIIPLQQIMAETWTYRLLPRFNASERDYVAFDLSGVRAFAEDENTLHTRIREDWKAGLLTLAQALTGLGLRPEPGDERLRIFDLTLGRFDQAPADAQKTAALQRIRQRCELLHALQLNLDYEEDSVSNNGHATNNASPVRV